MKICSIPGCGKKHRTKGFCKKHYADWHRSTKQCSIHGCSDKYFSAGLCGKHYQRRRQHGNPNVLTRNPPGHGHLRKDGYRVFFKNRKMFYEHRIIAELVLGRALTKDEVVHHIDHNPMNNSPENLAILKSNAEHRKAHVLNKPPCKICGVTSKVSGFCWNHYQSEKKKKKRA